MHNFFALAALAALATARKLPPMGGLWDPVRHINGSHFIDPNTNNTYKHFNCDVNLSNATRSFHSTIREFHARHLGGAIGSRAPKAVARKTLQTPINITTYMHVLSTTAKAGTVTPAMATAQLAALNFAYNPIGITFVPGADPTFTINDAWAVAAGADMDALKAALRKGTYKDLNLYFHTDLTGSILGTCTLPSTVLPNADPTLFDSDGCNLAAGTMPGGNIAGYNAGGTAIHETGHWLGLLHTFEGYSCDASNPGDFVDDTVQESVATNGCPSKPAKDSCTSVAGVDPVHNYMDYSTDACYTGFTPGQVQSIGRMWGTYRAGM